MVFEGTFGGKISEFLQNKRLNHAIEREFFIFVVLGERALSSAGLEHLPYKEGVVGSNPTEPTLSAKSIEHHSYTYL